MPAAYLGPDGPTWVGPLPPDSRWKGRGTILVVDPWNGNLVVEVEDSPSRVRSWRDGGWWLEEEMLTSTSDAPHTEVRYEWTEDRLSLVRTWSGIQCRYQYDDQGRLHRLVWADGARVLVGYDEQGRVDQIEGPGPG
ncbi:MAG: hypothetical protein QGG40_21915, partial [Myxococcota bacterium]|nr:hypothetical protein [Myxococcota bacterium]